MIIKQLLQEFINQLCIIQMVVHIIHKLHTYSKINILKTHKNSHIASIAKIQSESTVLSKLVDSQVSTEEQLNHFHPKR